MELLTLDCEITHVNSKHSSLSPRTGRGLLMRSRHCLALATLVLAQFSSGFVPRSPDSVCLRTQPCPQSVAKYRYSSYVPPESITRRPLPRFRGPPLSRIDVGSTEVENNKFMRGHLNSYGHRISRSETWQVASWPMSEELESMAVNRRSSELDAEALVDATVEEDLSPIGAMEAMLDVLGSSTQWVVAGSVGAVLVTEADVDTLVWVLGSLLNAGFAKFLKKAINQVRPDGSRLKDPGMPSSHAMSLFFLGTYLVIGLQEYGLVDCPIPKWPLDVTQTQVLLAVYAFTASLWRVKAGLHTIAQVSVGAVVGASDAALWYWFSKAYFTSQALIPSNHRPRVDIPVTSPALAKEQVEAFFGGTDVPVEVAVGVCLATVLTFGSAQRKVSKLFRRNEDAKER